MKIIKSFSLILLIIFQSNQVHAAVINVLNTNTEFEQGKFADLQGLDWLSFDETQNKSRTDIENGYGSLFNDGWRYATRTETANLLTSISPYQSFFSPLFYFGNSWFRDMFDPTASTGIHTFFYGATGECSLQTNVSCMGAHGILDFPLITLGIYSDIFGRSDSSTFLAIDDKDANIHSSLLVRDSNISNVPIPAAIYLFGAPLLGLFGISRHNKRLKQESI